MSLPLKVASTVVGIGALGTATVVGYSTLTRKSFESVLDESVLDLNGNQKEWEKRIKEFTASNSKLDSSLSKQKINTWEKIRDWCNNSKSDSFEEENIKYKNFEEFCTWKVEDKLTGHIPLGTELNSEKWRKAHGALKLKNDLPDDLKKITTSSESQDADKKAMHGWCTNAYRETWNKSKNSKVKLAEDHCKNSDS